MMRSLLWAAALLLALAPVGVAAGLWWTLSPGWGVAAGSVAYGALALWVLTADLLPDPSPGEAVR